MSRFTVYFYHPEFPGYLTFSRVCASEKEALLCAWRWLIEEIERMPGTPAFGKWGICRLVRRID